jgi:hypothetical protein
MDDGLTFPGVANIRRPSFGAWSGAALVSSAASVLVGVAMLFVPWHPPTTAYGACVSSLSMWFGCIAGLTPWLPFAFIFGGALGTYGVVWRLRR